MRSVWSARLLRVTGRISINRSIDSGVHTWRAARTITEMDVAINNRPTKLRFPQGSEVWITGCPKFGTAAKSGLTNPELKAETEWPEPRRWRSVSGFLRS
jgi:hypothetical protein